MMVSLLFGFFMLLMGLGFMVRSCYEDDPSLEVGHGLIAILFILGAAFLLIHFLLGGF